MKKTFVKAIAFMLVSVMLVFALASCGKISESYADKINKAAEKGEHYTYDQVVEDLGENAVEIAIAGTGVVVAVKDCDSLEDIQEKLEDGKKVKGIVVTMAFGKATGAKYKEITAEDLK